MMIELNKNGLNCMNFITDLLLEKINVNIICLCASHINEVVRFEKLENMLNSWNKQRYKTKLILSISYDENIKDIILTKI